MDDKKNDIHEDDLELEDIEERQEERLAKLRKKLKTCEAEKMSHLEELQRTKADFLNSRKRLEEQCTRDVLRATHTMIKELLPLADSFEMAMKDTERWEACDETWRAGIEGIHAQLRALFKKHNVSEVGVVGEAFNPSTHEAVSTTDTENSEAETIVEVLQKGYAINETLLRPAKVIISN